MDRKPVPIVILAFLHWLEPLFKILFYGIFYKMGVINYLQLLWNYTSTWEKFRFFFLLPLAGVFLFLVKKWSYYLFLLIEFFIFYLHYDGMMTLYHQQSYVLFSLIIFFSLLNLIVVTYFMLPQNRRPYYDPNMRWWEHFPRFTVNFPAQLNLTNKDQKESYPAKIINLSESGAYITLAEKIKMPVKQSVHLQFSFHQQSIVINGEIVHDLVINQIEGLGVRFHKSFWRDWWALKKMIRTIEKERYPRKPEKKKFMDQLRDWLKKLKTPTLN